MKNGKFIEILHSVPELNHDQRVSLEYELHHVDVKSNLCDLFEQRIEEQNTCLYCGSAQIIKNGLYSFEIIF